MELAVGEEEAGFIHLIGSRRARLQVVWGSDARRSGAERGGPRKTNVYSRDLVAPTSDSSLARVAWKLVGPIVCCGRFVRWCEFSSDTSTCSKFAL